MQGREIALLPEGNGQHLGAKAGTAHTQEKDGLEAAGLNVRAELGKGRDIGLLALDNVDPAHPVLLAVARPQAGVFLPESVNFVVGGPVGGCRIHGAAKLLREYKSNTHVVIDSA